jgi:hypothetical protein
LIRHSEWIMAKRIRPTEPTVPRIRPTEPTVRRLDPEAVAEALGGEPYAERPGGRPGPLTLDALREELLRRRQSSGGRPGIEGTDFRAKIPVGEQEWQRLEALAESLSAEGFSPSAGQVASVLLSIALRSVNADAQGGAAVVQELATRLGAEKNE